MKTRSYLFFSCFLLVIMGLLILVLSWMTHKELEKTIPLALQAEGRRLEHILSTRLDEIQTLMNYAGKRIAKDNYNNPNIIGEHLHNILGKKMFQRTTWDWPIFGWIDSKNMYTVNSVYGVFATPLNLSNRLYTTQARLKPGVLHFDPPTFGIPTNNWSLTGGIGVTDDLGNFLGIMGVELNIADLSARVKGALDRPDIEFVLIDLEGNHILHSALDADFYPISPLIKSAVGNFTGVSTKRVESLGFLSALKMPNYPFTILTYIKGENVKKFWLELLWSYGKTILGIGLFYFIILFFFCKRLRKENQKLDETKRNLEYALALAKDSDSAREQFLRSANSELMLPIAAIKHHVDILSKNLRREMDIELVPERKAELLDEIIKNALDFKNLTNNVLNYSDVELKSIISQCATILSKNAFDKKMHIGINVSKEIGKLYIDELKIKKIIIGLLSRAIKFSPKHETIQISASPENSSFIAITIVDHGFQSMDLSAPMEDTIDHLDMEMDAIEHLVCLHKGRLSKETYEDKSCAIKLLIPWLQSDPKKDKIALSQEEVVLPISLLD